MVIDSDNFLFFLIDIFYYLHFSCRNNNLIKWYQRLQES